MMKTRNFFTELLENRTKNSRTCSRWDGLLLFLRTSPSIKKKLQNQYKEKSHTHLHLQFKRKSKKLHKAKDSQQLIQREKDDIYLYFRDIYTTHRGTSNLIDWFILQKFLNKKWRVVLFYIRNKICTFTDYIRKCREKSRFLKVKNMKNYLSQSKKNPITFSFLKNKKPSHQIWEPNFYLVPIIEKKKPLCDVTMKVFCQFFFHSV